MSINLFYILDCLAVHIITPKISLLAYQPFWHVRLVPMWFFYIYFMSFFNQRNVASSIMELILLHHVFCTEIVMIHQDLSWGTINSCFHRCSYCVWKQAGCGKLASAAVKWWWLQNGSGKFENGNLMLWHTETLFIIESCYFPGGCCCIWVSRESVSNDYYYFLKIATH